jgi:hypothetical protein
LFLPFGRKKGALMKVKYIGSTKEQVSWGGNDDPARYLKIGKSYELLDKEVHSWHTKYRLKEFSAKRFNSVSFVESSSRKKAVRRSSSRKTEVRLGRMLRPMVE